MVDFNKKSHKQATLSIQLAFLTLAMVRNEIIRKFCTLSLAQESKDVFKTYVPLYRFMMTAD